MNYPAINLAVQDAAGKIVTDVEIEVRREILRRILLSSASALALLALSSRGEAMPLYVGAQKIAKVYKGATEISRLYKGGTLVFSSAKPFEGGNQSHGSIKEFVEHIASFGGDAVPTAGGTLTINSQSLGSYDYTIKNGDQTIDDFNAAEWFTTTEDSRSAFIVVKGNLTIDVGETLMPAVRKLFTTLYVTGNLVVNGEISMSARGANHSAASGSNISANAIRIATGTFSAVENPQVPAVGADGAAAASGSSGGTNGNAGSNGTNGQTGGGGGGGRTGTGGSAAHPGRPGTSFTGGSASGGTRNSSSTAPIIDGGKGGIAASNQSQVSGGGAGNPGGENSSGSGRGGDGTGGVLFVIVGGTLSGTGSITAAGMPGANADIGVTASAGGGSGGGSVTILYGSDSSSITPTALGGPGGTGGTATGGKGGDGTARKLALAA